MTADGTDPPRDDPKQRLEILLADYQSCREDERVQLAAVAAVIGVLVTLMGLMAAAVTQTCEFSSSKSCIAVPDYVLAASPLIPIALLAYAIYFLIVGTLRTYYMRGLENEIRNYISTPIISLGSLMPASYVGIVQEVTSMRRGRVLYRMITNLMLLVIILVFGGYTAYVGFHVDILYQILMSVAYSVIAILFVWQVALGSVGGRTFFEHAARDFLDNRPGTNLPIVRAGEDSHLVPDGRALLAYLILPRPEDWIKWLIAPGVFLAVAWSFGDFSRWRIFVELWLILEYFIYEARYQWNDVRGIAEDPLHSASQARHRLPVGPASRTRRNVLTSLAVATGRLTLALVIGEVIGLLGPVLALMAMVLSIAIVYERLRSLRPPSAPTRPTLTIVAIWCIVGLGYGVRAGLGLIAGGLSVGSSLTWIGISYFVSLGVMFVLLTWVLEATSFCYVWEAHRVWRVKTAAALKPHLIPLLRYVPIELKEPSHDMPNAEEDGSRLPILRRRGRILTPWNLALAVSAGLGAVLGVGLVHATTGYVPEAIAVPVSLVAAGLLVFCDSQQTRFMVSGVTFVVLIGAIGAFGRWPFSLLVAGPWLTVAALYLVFRGSSYQALKEFGPNLLKAISSVRIVLKLGPSMLHAVIGDKAWLAAGFENSVKAVGARSVVNTSQQAEPAITAPCDTNSPKSSPRVNRSQEDGRSPPRQ